MRMNKANQAAGGERPLFHPFAAQRSEAVRETGHKTGMNE